MISVRPERSETFGPADLEAMVAGVRQRGWLPLARAITRVENTPPWALALPAPPRPAHVIGITGPPGAGKSTLGGQLIRACTGAGKRIAVLAIDPSSPITGGAVLGDRLRMDKHLTGGDDVYVRSLASRGAQGAIATATRNVARLLELSELFDVIVIETVGAGQSEVAIAELADTVVLVTIPGLGDAVQAIKAGFLEVADVLVVNQADRPGATETMRHLRMNLPRGVAILKTIATKGDGVDELQAELDRRWQEMLDEGGLAEHRARKLALEAGHAAEAWTREIAGGLEIDPAAGLHDTVRTIIQEAAARWTS